MALVARLRGPRTSSNANRRSARPSGLVECECGTASSGAEPRTHHPAKGDRRSQQKLRRALLVAPRGVRRCHNDHLLQHGDRPIRTLTIDELPAGP